MRDDISAYSREVLDLFDAYVHGVIDRRGFLERCAGAVGGAAAAAGVLAALSPDFVSAQTIAPTDKRISNGYLEIASPQGHGEIGMYVARPVRKSQAPRPVVLVVHENRGLNLHIEDIARRLAVEGFIAVAPDALSSVGGYPGDEDKARGLFATLDRAKIAGDFMAAAFEAGRITGGNGKVGVTGFCFGGGIAGMLATKMPSLRAAAPFYGSPPPLDGIPAIKAEMLIHLAGNDARVNAAWPAAEAALKQHGTRYRLFTYEGAEHGFNNDTTPRFNPAAAKLAWGRTLDLFRRTLA
jgi:carboxymethylenebutenolidase